MYTHLFLADPSSFYCVQRATVVISDHHHLNILLTAVQHFYFQHMHRSDDANSWTDACGSGAHWGATCESFRLKQCPTACGGNCMCLTQVAEVRHQNISCPEVVWSGHCMQCPHVKGFIG